MIEKKRSGPLPISQYVDITQTEAFVAIQPLSGLRLFRPEDGSVPEFLPVDCPCGELGSALLAALQRCRRVSPDDRDFYNKTKYAQSYLASESEFLRRTGKRSKTDAYKNAVWCRVRRSDGQIAISPSRAIGRGKWKPLPGADRVSIAETTDPEAIGAAVLLAIERGRNFEG